VASRSITALGLVVCVVVLVVVLAIRNARRQQRARQVARWQRWESMQALRASTPESELAEVAVVYQRARHGAKAVIVWLANGHRQDTWFEGNWPAPGSVVLVRGSTGWGPHNRNPEVFFVRPDQILAMLPAGTRKALTQQHWRETRRGAR
jgi:hypothetical protein